MVRYGVIVKRTIDASADSVYNVLKDYRNGHPFILPSQYFEDVKIIRGYGIGEGTRMQKVYKVPILQKRYVLILDVSEPEPGRILQEIDTGAVNIIRFIVDPIVDLDDIGGDGGGTMTSPSTKCSVTIDVQMLNSLGIWAVFEMMMKKYVCYSMYNEALNELNRYMIHNNNLEFTEP
jgi:hypothetical protein